MRERLGVGRGAGAGGRRESAGPTVCRMQGIVLFRRLPELCGPIFSLQEGV